MILSSIEIDTIKPNSIVKWAHGHHYVKFAGFSEDGSEVILMGADKAETRVKVGWFSKDYVLVTMEQDLVSGPSPKTPEST